MWGHFQESYTSLVCDMPAFRSGQLMPNYWFVCIITLHSTSRSLQLSGKQLPLGSHVKGLLAPRHSSTLAMSCLLFLQLLYSHRLRNFMEQ